MLSRVEGEFADSVVLLDDGFQHHTLARDLDIVIVDRRTVEHPALLPEGDLREPPAALRRADIVLATSEAARCFAEHWKSEQAALFDLRFRSERIVSWGGDEILPAGARPYLVTGIARSERVARSVGELGYEYVGHIRYRDHYRYRSADVTAILRGMKRLGGSHIVTTGKDAVKLERFAEIRDLLYVVELEAVLQGQERFIQIIETAIAARREESGKQRESK
jgi:tetraacyldisaccharide 4'-kinase